MTSRERIHAVLEGRETDFIPVAPLFWGAEYVWKLTGLPLWEVLHGPGDMTMAVVRAVAERHDVDWVFLTHSSSQALAGKKYVREDGFHVYFVDESSGEEFVFHKEGHWLLPKRRMGEARISNQGSHTEPPRSKEEADEWLRQTHRHLFEKQTRRVPNRKFREQFPDKFLVGGVHCVFADLAYTLGFEPTLVLLHENPRLCTYIMEQTMAVVPEQCERLAADGFDAGLMCDSWASADIISPQAYRDYVAPFHKMASDELHKVGLKSIIYNTGNILPFLDTMSRLGYDALLPEERIKGVEIDIADVRRVLGPDICLFGNFDSYLLLRGDRQKIADEIKRQVYAAGPQRFVMSNGSPICDSTDPEVIDFWIAETRRAAL
ncbi:MAG: uroporphyrinogen decarboxylase family protein [Armatimonadota bacterium]|nr:uroporphyrinogen decarboxylase family protein [Armatimonadota bacterium]